MEFFPAFKEWALVCEALGEGKQTILIRKGGIAEGPAGFHFKHQEFFLFPTWFHEQLEKTILPSETPLPAQMPDMVEIRYRVSVEWSQLVTDFNKLKLLREFHILQDHVVHERFHYDEKSGIHVALVRVFRLDPYYYIPSEKKYGGCRSWINIPTQDDMAAFVSVLSDEEHSRRKKLLEAILLK